MTEVMVVMTIMNHTAHFSHLDVFPTMRKMVMPIAILPSPVQAMPIVRVIWMSLSPPSLIVILILVEPASREFSRSSLIALAGRCIICYMSLCAHYIQ